MIALSLVLVVAGACSENTVAALAALDARLSTLEAEASQLKQPRERDRMALAVSGLDDALASLRAELGCAGTDLAAPAAELSSATERARPQPVTLDAPGARALQSVLAGERFADVRLSALESGLSGRCVDPSTARQLLDAFRADAERLDAWRKIAPRLTDRTAGGTLVDRLGSEATKRAGRQVLLLPPVSGCVDDSAEKASDRPR
jgi:hypothetical protein